MDTIALIENSLTLAAERLGDITPLVMENFYARFPACQAVFERLSLGKPHEMEGEMVTQTVYSLLAVVEQGLASKTDLTLSQEMTLSGGPAAVAKVLTLASGSVEKAVIESITQRNHELAQQISNLMFAFEDLTTLDGKSMQRILRDVDSKELALAMKAQTALTAAASVGVNMPE